MKKKLIQISETFWLQNLCVRDIVANIYINVVFLGVVIVKFLKVRSSII